MSSDYRVKKREPTKHRMITHVDDILGILRELDDEEEDGEKTAIFLIHQHDDLNELLWQLHGRGKNCLP